MLFDVSVPLIFSCEFVKEVPSCANFSSSAILVLLQKRGMIGLINDGKFSTNGPLSTYLSYTSTKRNVVIHRTSA